MQPRWLDRVHARIDGLLANERFRHWAAGFPLTRPIARRRARALFDLCAGFVYSQVLLACVRLRAFEVLAEGPRTAAQLAPRFDLTVDACRRLLDAAVALRLVARRSDARYALGPLGASLVGNEALAAMIEHHALLYADLADPLALLRSGGRDSALQRYWAYAGSGEPAGLEGEAIARYSALMSASQPLVAGEILDAYPIAQHRRLLDVGGGEGTFLAAAGARAAGLQLMLFDLPAVAERARPRLAGFGARVQLHGGSFLSDELPHGADLLTLIRVLHDHDDDAVLRILRACRRALAAGGTLLIAEPMSDTPGAETVGDAYFGFYLLAMGSGRPRTAARLVALLREAGFGAARLIPTRVPLQTRLLCVKTA